MTKTTTGWVMFICALGMMSISLGEDIKKLMDWGEMMTPPFVGLMFVHFGSTLMAFLGGKIIPEQREGQHTRESDLKAGDPQDGH